MIEPTTTRPPDRPPVPRTPIARGWVALFAVLGLAGVGGYSALAFTGTVIGAPKRDEVPASVRSSPGGYRSYHFWHSGYHGGK